MHINLDGIDMITTNMTNIEDNIGLVGSNIIASVGRNYDYLSLNVKSNTLKYKEVRQAISYGINKEEIINTVYGSKYFVRRSSTSIWKLFI